MDSAIACPLRMDLWALQIPVAIEGSLGSWDAGERLPGHCCIGLIRLEGSDSFFTRMN